jgi:RNA polymerase sigma-70 factor (ECF subfamily)
MRRRFTDTVEQYRHRIYTFSHYFLGNSEDAEDVTQEVLVRLWRHWHGLDASRMQGWLTRVTRNACVDALRRRGSYRAVVSEEAYEELLDAAVSDRPDPRSVLERSDLRGQVERALGKLDEPYRSIVILREIQEMTYAEISEALDIPLNRVKVYLHRGRRTLRDQLRERVEHDNVG